VNFQWSQAEDVLHYVAEVDVTPEFRNPVIKKQMTVTSFADSSLNEGIWYWRVTPVFSETGGNGGAAVSNIQPRTSTFRIIKDREPQTAQILAQIEEEPKPAPAPEPEPVSRLPVPSNRRPAEGYRIGIEEVKRENITFRWSAVPEANAYLFTIYQITGTTRRQVTQIGPENRTTWTTKIKTLGRGNFVWRVEAVNVGHDNVIERHGNPGENRFVVDIPRAGPVQIPEVQQ